LLSLAPQAARDRRLDTFYPVSTRPRYPYDQGYLSYSSGFKRYVDGAGRFEFRYPAVWVQDQAIFLANADRAYTQRVTDPNGLLGTTPSRPRGPDVAFGPPGQTGEENLSVVIGPVQSGFTLRLGLGDPVQGADRLIQTSIAKAGVREATLLEAFERLSAKSGKPLYQFEYRVDYPGLEGKQPTYTICTVGVASGSLFTFTSRVPSAVWQESAEALREAASSFELL